MSLSLKMHKFKIGSDSVIMGLIDELEKLRSQIGEVNGIFILLNPVDYDSYIAALNDFYQVHDLENITWRGWPIRKVYDTDDNAFIFLANY